MNQEDLDECQATELNICHPTVSVHQGTFTCSSALFLSDAEQVEKLCEPYFVRRPRDTWVGFDGGAAWAFSLASPAKVSFTNAAGQPRLTNVTKLPETGLLTMPPNMQATVRGQTMLSGAVFTQDVEDDVVIPDLPSLDPVHLYKEANRSEVMGEISRLLNATVGVHLSEGISMSRMEGLLDQARRWKLDDYISWETWGISGFGLAIMVIIALLIYCLCSRCVCNRRSRHYGHGGGGGTTIIPLSTMAPPPLPAPRQSEARPMLSHRNQSPSRLSRRAEF